MNAWMIGVGYAGSLVACSTVAREWARRKGLNTRAWGMAGAVTGPVAVMAVGAWKARAALCPHCLAPISFEARYCPTCRAIERGEAVKVAASSRGVARLTRRVLPKLPRTVPMPPDADVSPQHGFFEPSRTKVVA